MKFSLFVRMERVSADEPQQRLYHEMIEPCEIADQNGMQAIWTGARRMIRGLQAGVVWLNSCRAVSPIAPFGGQGRSGDGREGGLAAALDDTKIKTVWLRTSDDPIPDPFVMR